MPVPKGYVPLLYGQLGKQYISRDRLRPVKCFISDLYIGFLSLAGRGHVKNPEPRRRGKGFQFMRVWIDMKRSKLTFYWKLSCFLRDAGKCPHRRQCGAQDRVALLAGRPGHAVREYSRTCSRTSAHRSFRYSTGVHYRGAVRSTRAYNVQTPSRRG